MCLRLIQIIGEVRERSEQVSDERYKHTLMYQYLIGGDAAEVSGDYTPDMHANTHREV